MEEGGFSALDLEAELSSCLTAAAAPEIVASSAFSYQLSAEEMEGAQQGPWTAELQAELQAELSSLRRVVEAFVEYVRPRFWPPELVLAEKDSRTMIGYSPPPPPPLPLR